VNDIISVGGQVNDWTILDEPFRVRAAGNRYTWYCMCRCVCKTEKRVRLDRLRSREATRCRACMERRAAERSRRRSNRPTAVPAAVWARLRGIVNGVFRRCFNPRNNMYANYGGRGVSVCEAWREDRDAFTMYLASLPGASDPDLSLDRINNDGDYEPGNLRWATASEQARNRRFPVAGAMYEVNGRRLSWYQVRTLAFQTAFGCTQAEFVVKYRVEDPDPGFDEEDATG